MRASLVGLALCAISAAGCVPADEAIGLGSVQFAFTVSTRTAAGLSEDETDGWAVRFDRLVLGFKTMTIGKIGVDDVCAYRGRGATSDVVFDPRVGLVQTFNGIEPVACPDVGLIFGAPSAATTLGNGVTSKDLVELASGDPAHAIIEATATWQRRVFGDLDSERNIRILLRFDSERTSTRFGGCREAERGVRILERTRDEVSVRFAAEHLFRNSLSSDASLRVRPFVTADERGNKDGIVTMDELDAMPLRTLQGYAVFDGAKRHSFGDFVRFLFRNTLMFRTEDGVCIGNDPGADEQAP